jgi:hypothetical protein
MRHFLVLSVLVCLLIIICSAILIPGTETAAQEPPTPEATKPGYTNYSGYYRMRCWPACHTRDFPESIKPRNYTNYSGYYRMRCWPACHTKDFPESVKKSMEAGQGE